MQSISFAVSLGMLFYSVSINQPTSPTQNWAWQKMEVAPFDSLASHTSVATFSFPKGVPRALSVFTTDTPGVTVDIISLILGEDKVFCQSKLIERLGEESLFMSFNWTGGNWTLRFGIQTKGLKA